jgi:hypothetical protein
MMIQDTLGIILLLAATRNRGWLAGIMDSVQWLVGITTTTISVSAFQGHSMTEKILVVAIVSAANLFGTKLGEVLGNKYVGVGTIHQRVAALENDRIDNKHSQ